MAEYVHNKANEGTSEKKLILWKLGSNGRQRLQPYAATAMYAFSGNNLVAEEHIFNGIYLWRSMECFWKTPVNIHAHNQEWIEMSS